MRTLHAFALTLCLGGCFGSAESTPEPRDHRPEPQMCDNERDSPVVTMSTIDGECTSHEQCDMGSNGRCLPSRAGNSCNYDGCFADADCTGPCICGVGVSANSCKTGGCQVDADCGPGGWCSPTFGGCGPFGGVVAYECHTPDDECTDNTDCIAPNSYCKFASEAGRWVCDTVQCAG